MKCETCEGRGFKEYEHGLIMVKCEECKGTGEWNLIEVQRRIYDTSNSGTKPDNRPARSTDTSKSKQPKKPKAKKRARKGTH